MTHEETYWYNRASVDANYSAYQHQLQVDILVHKQEYGLVETLKPKIFPDGNQWCVLYGENLQMGVAGFGNTPYAAILEFNKAFYTPLTPQQ